MRARMTMAANKEKENSFFIPEDDGLFVSWTLIHGEGLMVVGTT
jgi:hypothetical protein